MDISMDIHIHGKPASNSLRTAALQWRSQGLVVGWAPGFGGRVGTMGYFYGSPPAVSRAEPW